MLSNLFVGKLCGLICAMLAFAHFGVAHANSQNMNDQTLTSTQAVQLARLVLSAIDREFPHKPGVVFSSVGEVERPRTLHPAFYGSFDWHSSMHGHWLLVRLLKQNPEMPLAGEIRARLNSHLSLSNSTAEAGIFDRSGNRSFERMYGWAWALRLASEIHTFNDPDAQRWATNFYPLERKLVGAIKDYLPKLSYPVRTGVHPDTGFALAQILDYAHVVGDVELVKLVEQRAREFYGQDKDYPVAYEPSGEDFFSSGLNEADLMRRILTAEEFSKWLDGFWPGLKKGSLGSWGIPAQVSDLSDPKIVHLVGLNLSRAWTLCGVASVLPKEDQRRLLLEKAVAAHGEAGLKCVFSGHYEGEHWLGTFAVYYFTRTGLSSEGEQLRSTKP